VKASHSADVGVPAGTRPRSPDEGALPLVGLVVGAVAVAALANPDTIEDGPVICPFRLVTGLPCPGCGLTRSWVYLVHGQWLDSVAANPFGAVLLALGLAFVLMVAVAVTRRRPLPELGSLIRRPAFYALGGAWALFGLVRAVAQAFGAG
jgi:hypothetical protein